jgi:hypothetical protein
MGRCMTRDPLPNWRRGQTFRLWVDGRSFLATLGYYEDGRIGEIFLRVRPLGPNATIVS